MKRSTMLFMLLCFFTNIAGAEPTALQTPKASYKTSTKKVNTIGNRPKHLAPNHHKGSNKDWSCPPVSDADGTGKCGLDLGMQETICDGEGGASSTGRDGGHTCSFPD